MNGWPIVVLLWLFGRGRGGLPSWPRPRPSFPAERPPADKPPGQPPGQPPPVKLQPLPGSGWKPYAPLNGAVVARAKALLARLPLGQWMTEPDPTKPGVEVAYRAERHPQGKRGITVYKRADPGT